MSTQRAQQGFQPVAALRSRLLSTNPSRKKLQDQNASAEAVQTNRIHLVTSLNDWSSHTPLLANPSLVNRNVQIQHPLPERDD